MDRFAACLDIFKDEKHLFDGEVFAICCKNSMRFACRVSDDLTRPMIENLVDVMRFLGLTMAYCGPICEDTSSDSEMMAYNPSRVSLTRSEEA